MPLPAPPIDNRRYQDLFDELVQRIPVHTPEWTNFNASDPGITLVQLYAHITESLLYRANQIPDRNRAKFLSLLGVRLNPAKEARGIVAFTNENGPIEETRISRDTELLAGTIPFRTATSLDALPIEAKLYVKRTITNLPTEQEEYYQLLFASYGKPDELNSRKQAGDFHYYESIDVTDASLIDLGSSVDRSLWVAVLARDRDLIGGLAALQEKLEGRTLSLGIIPENGFEGMTLGPIKTTKSGGSLLEYALPKIAPRAANQDLSVAYEPLVHRADFDPLTQAGIVELTLPKKASANAPSPLDTWRDLDPLETGVGDLPPAIDDAKIADRVITWIRISASAASDVRLSWVGINAAQVRQFIHVSSERLADGDGNPDQSRQLGKPPVLEGSVKISSFRDSARKDWVQIDDILASGPEVPVYGVKKSDAPVDVFTVDHEAGVVRFGDGLTGRRPRAGEALYASYSYSEGVEGNVAASSLKAGPLVPTGITATNPVPTWGGADAETITMAEKQVPRALQHRERLVTAEDYRTIAWRTPGVTIGRIEVLPACHADIEPVAVGTAPGAVTLMALPRSDPAHPSAPRSDKRFLNALCDYLDPRRLVTTELVLRGATYVGLWLSIGIEVQAGHQTAEVIDAVKARIQAYLSPLPAPEISLPALLQPLYAPESDPTLRGWPLNKAVHSRTVLAEVARTPGVVSVANVLMAGPAGQAVELVEITGLELPELLGISVVEGEPLSLEAVMGRAGGTGTGGSGSGAGKGRLPVPVLAETC